MTDVLAPDLERHAGVTEPLRYEVDLRADAEWTLTDVGGVVLFAWIDGADANHVDGATVSPDGVTAVEEDDGWTNTLDLSFDPVGNAADGGDAFRAGQAGIYRAYSRVLRPTGTVTRHPRGQDLVWRIRPGRE